MFSSPIHEICSILIWTEEEDLRVGSVRDIDDGAFDTWSSTWNQEIDDRLGFLNSAEASRGQVVRG
jgi:hypothetical protein